MSFSVEKLLSVLISVKVKECGTKVQNGTLEAFPGTAAGVHMLVYGGLHVLALNVIPLLALKSCHMSCHIDTLLPP